MDEGTFQKAVMITEQINMYKEHREQLVSSCILHGGGLIFTYNKMYSDVRLKSELYDPDFLRNYMQNLDKKIESLQKEFDEL